MFANKKILAIIPARSGSKGLKNKNIVDFAGKPLIGWTILAACGVKEIDRVIVSTDNKRIAQISESQGTQIPFLRPKGFAQDKSPMEQVIRHAVWWFAEKRHEYYDYVLLLQPTSPLRTSKHIREAMDLYFKKKRSKNDMVISISPVSSKMGWLMQTKAGDKVDFCFKSHNKQRQQLAQYYLPNGAIFFGTTEMMTNLSQKNINRIGYVMSQEVSVDIDTPLDLKAALENYYGKKQ